MAQHALLSASSAHRWLNCTLSARLEEQFENEESVFAAEGTFMHSLAELYLKSHMKAISSPKFQKELAAMKKSEYFTDENDDAVLVYVELVIERFALAKQTTSDAVLLIEQKLDFSNYAEGGFGTGDAVIIADDILEIIDFKGGKGVSISAVKNPQMRLYAIGALNAFDFLYDIKTVRMTICQPRLSDILEEVLTVSDLLAWGENELKPKARLAFDGEGDFSPGEYTCKFCRAKRACRARTEKNLEMARFDFELPSLLCDEEISEILAAASELSSWVDGIYSYATDKAIRENKKWDGFKLVEGKSNRKYTDELAVAEACKKNGFKDIYKQSLLGITGMEKLLGKKFNTILSGLVVKPKGNMALVQDSDKRQKINNEAEADFTEEL